MNVTINTDTVQEALGISDFEIMLFGLRNMLQGLNPGHWVMFAIFLCAIGWGVFSRQRRVGETKGETAAVVLLLTLSFFGFFSLSQTL